MDGYGRAQDTRVQAGRGTLSSDSGPVLSPPQVLPLDLILEVSIACTQLGHEALGLEAELLPSLGLIMPFWDVDMGWREAGPYCRHICSAHMCPRTHGQLGAGLLGQAADMHAAQGRVLGEGRQSLRPSTQLWASVRLLLSVMLIRPSPPVCFFICPFQTCLWPIIQEVGEENWEWLITLALRTVPPRLPLN